MTGDVCDDGAGAVLVVGADGTIGAAVAARLEATGGRVIRTSRRGTAGSLPLDLAAIPPSWKPPAGVAAAVLCAAVTSTDACREQPEESRRVNVDATVDLGRRLADAGIRIVFLSTRLFDVVRHRILAGIRSRHPDWGQAEVEAEFARQLETVRRLDDRGIFTPVGQE